MFRKKFTSKHGLKNSIVKLLCKGRLTNFCFEIKLIGNRSVFYFDFILIFDYIARCLLGSIALAYLVSRSGLQVSMRMRPTNSIHPRRYCFN
ncbi:hypothetical protein CI610_01137 [invertebrate metagenome]|uniref:Uncharacterized protein n=1 Tax=invertebrate metagenome TaxID=1711999 RepID=A0A2H9T9N1_9ZZZZ